MGLGSRPVKVVIVRDSAKMFVEMLKRRNTQYIVVFVQKMMPKFVIQRLNCCPQIDSSTALFPKPQDL